MMQKKLGSFIKSLVSLFGHKIIDCRSGVLLGRAFLLTWRGRFYVLAYDGDHPLRLVWLSENKTRYWRSRIGFTVYTEEELLDG